MTRTLTIQLKQLHPLQRKIAQSPARFRVLAIGRRTGKSELGKDILANKALEVPGPYALCVPTYKTLRVIWDELKSLLHPVIKHINEQEKRMELLTGSVIDGWSLDAPDGPRGRKYRGVIIDEAASIPKLEYAWNEVLRPTLTDYKGWALFLSTPKGRNFFWQVYQWGLDPLMPEWASWNAPTLSNPHIDPSEIEAARQQLPARVFEQEYLAQFLDDGGAVFRHVAQAVKPAPQQWGDVVMGVDWGRHNDFTVIVALDSATKQVIALDRFNQIGWGVQRDRIKAMVERYRPRLILAEANSIGEPNLEQLQKEGLPVQPFTTTNQSKAHIIEQAAGLLERGEAGLIDDPVLIHELEAYTMERLPSGAWRYSAPDGGHDDCVMAWALAVEAAGRRPAIARVSSNPFWGG